MTSELKTAINNAVKDAMRAKEKERLGALRMVTAEIKNIEINERIEVDDSRVLAVLDKMVKQRKDSAEQFAANDRPELAEKERFEISVIQDFLPQQLTSDEIQQIITSTAEDVGASGMADMGKLMAALKPKMQGRADMGQVSAAVKSHLK